MNTTKDTALQFTPAAGFWKERTDAVIYKAIPYQWKALNNEIPGAPGSHAVQNFKIAAGEVKGERKGTIFQDSDIAKWIEAAAYSLRFKPDAELEGIIDELVRLIEKSQMSDGYVNTYFIASAKTSERWSDLVMGHELYCAGHMMEAAAAYFKVTGKRTLLDVMCRYADYIGTVFGHGENQNPGFDGHPEIELALHRLAEAAGNKKYAELANYFVDIRGSVPNFHIGKAAMEGMIPKTRWFGSDYYLADKPVREMTGAQGHSVRAMYLYCAMADQYVKTRDASLLTALKKIWNNVVQKHMYITGGLGSHAHGERFSIDYDLPNDTCYTETCASIGLAMWAWRMLSIEKKGIYADIMEKAVFNGILSGMSLDGTKYFYVNPLKLLPEVTKFRHDHAHVAPERVSWFDCACCPTNAARFILQFTEYLCSADTDGLWIHHFAQGRAAAVVDENTIQLEMKTNYPWDGDVDISLGIDKSEEFSVYLRIPHWCSKYTLAVNKNPILNSPHENNGYICIRREWHSNDIITLNLEMAVRFIQTNSNVSENAGKIALQRGPLIYCAEEADNGKGLHLYSIKAGKKACLVQDSSLPSGTIAIEAEASFEKDTADPKDLYFEYVSDREMGSKTLRFIPYYQWGNRKPGNEMSVWFNISH
ncbi:MAG TPA: glycoside hydrolase family 127 protein [Treponemataceae bacterium]|nr:glycoside hydrolase family 127 protein [Treponemataceae bacterium]HQL03804.1 glycoside hydrolase family 127 protein [Treponemataceae bacterium]